MSFHVMNNTDESPLPDLSFDDIEQLLIRAYVRLIFMAKGTDGSRATIVAQFGSLEVRLTEFTNAYKSRDMPPLWIEIYSYATCSTVDSYGCFELDEEELSAAVEAILQAKHRRKTYH